MPLSLPLLAGSAPEHEYVFTDFLAEDEDALDFNGQYHVVGISYRVSAEKKAFEMADKFRQTNAVVVLGGPQASAAPLKAKKHADIVVVGEAEKTWPQLLYDVQHNKHRDFYLCTPGPTHYFEGFNVYKTSEMPDIKATPTPIRYLYKKKYRFDMIYAARGCPIDCSFCHVSRIYGTKMRFRSHEDIIPEIENFGRHFFLIDDSAFGRKNCFDYYLQLYKRIAAIPKKRFWIGQGNLDAAADERGREVIQQAARSGLSYVSVGLESVNADNIKKTGILPKMGITDTEVLLEQLKQNITFIQQEGIAVSAWFTIGLEHDTIDSCRDTLEFCLSTHVFPVLNPIQALEGTRFFEELKEADLLLEQDTNVSNVKNVSMSNEDFITIMQEVLDKAYSKKIMTQRVLYYFRKLLKKNVSFFELIHRLILIHFTQLKLKKVLKYEIVRFKKRLS